MRGSRATLLVDKIVAACDARKLVSLSPDDVDLIVTAGTLRQLLAMDVSDIETQARLRLDGASTRPIAASGAKQVTDHKRDDDMPFSVASLAERWNVSSSMVRKIIRAGDLDHFKLGGQLIRIPAQAVTDFEMRIQAEGR